MNIHEEINKYSSEADKPILRWLFEQYHMDFQWRFVATCTLHRYGVLSYETHRVWTPTMEGRVLFAYAGGNSTESPYAS